MKIAFFGLEKWEERYISGKLKDELMFFPKMTASAIKKAHDADALVIFIYTEITSAVLERFPRVKLIATMSTGFDHIDTEACRKRGIRVCNVPFYGENTVAEHTFALILTLSRKIHDAIEKTRHDDFTLSGLMGFDLKGKTLGVIGPGHIGQHVIKIARGFEMEVIAHGKKEDRKLAKRVGFKFVSLPQLLKQSDVITLHAPLTSETKHMINSESIKLIKPGALLVNTSRGGLVDTTALIKALDKKIIAGAALDVLEGECDIKEERQLLHKEFEQSCDWQMLIKNHVLLKDKNVVVTPHSAFYSREALQRIADTTLGNIKAFKKKRPINLVK